MKNIDRKRKIGFGMILVGATAAICIILFWFFGTRMLRLNQVELEPEQIRVHEDVDSITIPGFEKMTIKAGETSVETYLYNPEGNDCYFEISIVLADTEEVLYQSKMVSPGQALYEIELTRALEAGEYDAIVRYKVYDLSDYSDKNGANVPFVLEVVE